MPVLFFFYVEYEGWSLSYRHRSHVLVNSERGQSPCLPQAVFPLGGARTCVPRESSTAGPCFVGGAIGSLAHSATAAWLSACLTLLVTFLLLTTNTALYFTLAPFSSLSVLWWWIVWPEKRKNVHVKSGQDSRHANIFWNNFLAILVFFLVATLARFLHTKLSFRGEKIVF